MDPPYQKTLKCSRHRGTKRLTAVSMVVAMVVTIADEMSQTVLKGGIAVAAGRPATNMFFVQRGQTVYALYQDICPLIYQ